MKTIDGLEFVLGMTLFKPESDSGMLYHWDTLPGPDTIRDGKIYSWQRSSALTVEDKYGDRDTAQAVLDDIILRTKDGVKFELGMTLHYVDDADCECSPTVSTFTTSPEIHYIAHGHVCCRDALYGHCIRGGYADLRKAMFVLTGLQCEATFSKQEAIIKVKECQSWSKYDQGYAAALIEVFGITPEELEYTA